MPYKIDHLSFSLTDVCPITCRHCLTDCSNEKKETLDFELLKIFLEQTSRILKIETIGITGGEPFYFFEYLVKVMKYIHENYNYNIGIISNGFWASDFDVCKQKLSYLKKIGLNEIIISTDKYHQEFVPLNNISNILKVSEKLKFKVTLRHVYTNDSLTKDWMRNFYKAGFSEEKFHIIKEMEDNNIENKILIENQPCLPLGRAKLCVLENNIPIKKLDNNCKEVNSACFSVLKFIHMFCDGNISFCCGAFDVKSPLIQGNIREENFNEILNKAFCSPIHNLLYLKGFSEIFEFLESSGFALPKKSASMCHLCHLIFTNKDYSKALSSYLKKNALKYLIEREIYDNKYLKKRESV
jgi:organic radical activating enzyme